MICARDLMSALFRGGGSCLGRGYSICSEGPYTALFAIWVSACVGAPIRTKGPSVLTECPLCRGTNCRFCLQTGFLAVHGPLLLHLYIWAPACTRAQSGHEALRNRGPHSAHSGSCLRRAPPSFCLYILMLNPLSRAFFGALLYRVPSGKRAHLERGPLCVGGIPAPFFVKRGHSLRGETLQSFYLCIHVSFCI